MTEVFLGLGSNKGNRLDNIQKALFLITEKIGKIIKKSDIYETEAWGFYSDNFYNSIIKIKTNLSPFDLLEKIKNIEKKLGRKPKKTQNYEPRTIDIDILFYGNLILLDQKLQIPHPLLHKRLFVLKPLADVQPDLMHPLLEQNILQIIKQCEDKTKIFGRIKLNSKIKKNFS